MLVFDPISYGSMDISELMVNDWFRLYNIFDPMSSESSKDYILNIFHKPYINIQITEDILKKGDFNFFDRLRGIELNPIMLQENGFMYNKDKDSYDLALYDGLVRVNFNNNSPALPTSSTLTIYLKETKFHGTCYSVDKFQKITRICGLLKLANNFKVNQYD